MKHTNKYTYDTYNRQHTRSFDTDFSEGKDGVERVETYHYNSLNQRIRTDNDIQGQGGEIDSYILYDKNVFGKDTNVKSYSNDKLTSDISYEYDTLERAVKRTNFSLNGTPARIIETKYDAYNRQIEIFTDENANGLFDGREGKQIFERDTDANGTVLSRTDVYADGREIYSRWTHDELNRRIATHRDDNRDGVLDANEENWKISFIGQTNMFDVVEIYRGSTFVSGKKVHYDNSNAAIATFRSGADKLYTSLHYDGYDNPRSSAEDFTASHYDELFNQYGGNLQTIQMTDNKFVTEITLDNNVLAKLSQNVTPTTVKGDTVKTIVLTINGDATDSVRLKNYSEFTKVEGTVKVGANNYDKLTTQVGEKTYTLLVDTDIKLFDAANPGVEII